MSILHEGKVVVKGIQTLRRIVGEFLQEYRNSEGLNGVEGFCGLRTVFENAVNSTIRYFDAAQTGLEEWKESVFRGDKEYDQIDEEAFRSMLQSWLPLGEFLFEEATTEAKLGRYLAAPRRLGILRARVQAARRMLEGWVTPAAEVSIAFGLRTVQMDKDQTKFLRSMLASSPG